MQELELSKWQKAQLQAFEKRKELFILVPKKNGKGHLIASILLKKIKEQKPCQIMLVSVTKETCENIFNILEVAIYEELEQKTYTLSERMLTLKAGKVKIKAFGIGSKAFTGNNADIVVVDELWAINTAKHTNAMREVIGGALSKDNGQVIYISTMPDNPPAGIFKEKLDFFRQKSNRNKQGFYKCIYELPDKYSIDNFPPIEEVFNVNPNLGISISKNFLISQYTQAISSTRVQKQSFLSKQCNLEPKTYIFEQEYEVKNMMYKIKNINHQPFDANRYKYIYAGYDGGGIDDLIGFAVIGVLPDDNIECYIYCFYQMEQLKRYPFQANLVHYPHYIGYDHNQTANTLILKLLNEMNPFLNAFGYDPNGGMINDLIQKITPTFQWSGGLMSVKQGGWLTIPAQMFQADVSMGKVSVAGFELFKNQIDVLKLKPRGDIFLIEKDLSAGHKIDGIQALFTAYSVYIEHKKKKNLF